MANAKILLIGLVLLLTSVASAKDMDDVLLEELNTVSDMQVSMRMTDQESSAASQALLAGKYRKYKSRARAQKNDGMIVAFRPAHR